MRRNILLVTLCLFVLGGTATRAVARDGDGVKTAEVILEKLRRLGAAGRDPAEFRRAAARLYPGLFVAVAELKDSDIKTDLATAVALYEAALRAPDDAAADCEAELRESYLRACRESAAGGRAALLRAKAELHAGWAEAGVRRAQGSLDGATLLTLSILRAERRTDLALAEEALSVLQELTAAPTAAAREKAGAGLRQLDRVLASLPRGRVHTALRNARDAFRDGLYWESQRAPGQARVVNVASLAAADPLRLIGLDDGAAARAADANRRAALKFIGRAEAAVREARNTLQTTE